MHQPGDEPLEELALAEDDDRLVPGSLRDVAGAVGRAARPDEPGEVERPPREHAARERDRGEERERGDGGHAGRAFVAGGEARQAAWLKPGTGAFEAARPSGAWLKPGTKVPAASPRGVPGFSQAPGASRGRPTALRRGHAPRTRRSSAEIAGSTSCRSPITA